MESLIVPAANLGGVVFITVSFLFYLLRKDTQLTTIIDESIDARKLNENVGAVKENTDVVDKNTAVIQQNGNGHLN